MQTVDYSYTQKLIEQQINNKQQSSNAAIRKNFSLKEIKVTRKVRTYSYESKQKDAQQKRLLWQHKTLKSSTLKGLK